MTAPTVLSGLSPAVADLAADAACSLTHGLPFDIGYVRRANRKMSDLARTSPSAGCLAFRVVSNASRMSEAQASGTPFATSPSFARVVASLASGRLVVTGLEADRTTARTWPDGTLTVTARNLLVTGVAFADYVLVETAVDDDTSTSVLIVPTSAITAQARPPLRGLRRADNARIDIAATVRLEEAMLSHRGDGRHLVELPYRLGLTFGAVAHGAMLALCDHVTSSARFADVPEIVGRVLIATAAAGAMVEASSSAYGTATWLSRAAKVHATRAAEHVAALAVGHAGAGVYSTEHPLTRLANDIAGLGHQAPSNDGSLRYLAERPGVLLSEPTVPQHSSVPSTTSAPHVAPAALISAEVAS